MAVEPVRNPAPASFNAPTRRDGVRAVAFVGVCAALSFVCGMVGWTAPQGGRVSLADVPVLALALAMGWRPACLAGALAGLLHYPQQPVTVHPLSLLLDYPVSGACLGLAGLPLFRRPGRVWPLAGVVTAIAGKYAVHVWSGVLFWAQGLQGLTAWRFSLIYNATYMLPTLGVDLAVMAVLARRMGQGRGAHVA